MRSVTYAIVLLVAGALPAAAADWASLPAMPTATFGAGATALGSDFYVIGGSGISTLTNVNVWNEAAGAWSQASPMSTARQHPGAAALGGKVYALGGYGPFGAPLASAERFDPASGSWSAVTAMPAVRALAGVVALNGMIYVMSGEGDAGQPQESCFRYDPGTNGWTQLPPVITARSGAAAAVLNGEIYLVGGAYFTSLATTEIFNPASGWRAGPAMPEALWMPTAAAFEGRIWVMGGFDVGFNRSDRVYSLGSDGVWQQESSMPLALAGAAAASDGMRLVVAGGMNASGQPVAAALERMSETPPPPPPPPPPAEGDTLFCSVELSPNSLNLKSNGHWIAAGIRCDEGSVESIDVASLTLGGVAVDMGAPVSVENGVLRVKFPREGFRFLADGEYTLPLEGATHEGDAVYGEGWIRIAGGEQKKPHNKPLPVMKPGRGNGQFAAGSIEFSIEAPMVVTMDVLDVQGRHLGTLADGPFAAGTHTVEWSAGRQAPAGVYFVRARFGNDVQFARFAVIR